MRMGISEAVKKFEDEEYSTWLLQAGKVQDDSSKASKELNDIAGKHAGGLTPDSIKDSKEFKDAKKKYDIAAKTERDFNKKSPKNFLKKKALDRRKNLTK